MSHNLHRLRMIFFFELWPDHMWPYSRFQPIRHVTNGGSKRICIMIASPQLYTPILIHCPYEHGCSKNHWNRDISSLRRKLLFWPTVMQLNSLFIGKHESKLWSLELVLGFQQVPILHSSATEQSNCFLCCTQATNSNANFKS